MSRRITRSLRLSLVAAMLAVFAFTATAQAHTYYNVVATNCGPYTGVGPNGVCMKEDANLGGDVILAATSFDGHIAVDASLGLDDVPGTHICNGGLFNNGSWNDCISSYSVNLKAGWHFCMWENANWTGIKYVSVHGPLIATFSLAGAPGNDNVSSWRLDNTC